MSVKEMPVAEGVKLNDIYRVKWTEAGRVRYGVVVQFDDGDLHVEEEFKKGFVFVDDAILPIYHKLPVSKVTPVDMGFDSEYDKYVEAELEKAQKVSDAAGNGMAVGKLFQIGVADGAAWYVVTKINKKTCVVEWRGFSLDRYHAQIIGAGGTFQISQIERHVVCYSNRLAMMKLFKPVH